MKPGLNQIIQTGETETNQNLHLINTIMSKSTKNSIFTLPTVNLIDVLSENENIDTETITIVERVFDRAKDDFIRTAEDKALIILDQQNKELRAWAKAIESNNLRAEDGFGITKLMKNRVEAQLKLDALSNTVEVYNGMKL